MDTLDMSRRAILSNEEQLGPYPLEMLKRVDKLTVDIKGESEQVPEREMAFAKARLGGFGPVVAKNMEDFTVRIPLGAAFYHYQKYINAYPEGDPAPEKAPLPEDLNVLTRHIKKATYFCGAEQVGICEIPDDVYYTEKLDGTPVTSRYKYAIVFLIRTHLPTLEASHGDEFLDDTVAFQAYQHLTGIANTMAEYIRILGYPARSNSFNNYITIMPRLITLAGLGEFSRLGIVINPFVGAAFKAAAVLTDLPLIPDKPIDFDLQNYCQNLCTVCVDQCPSHAISGGEKEEYRNYMRWNQDQHKCIAYDAANKHGCTCGRCTKICPFTRPDSFPEAFWDWDGNLKYIYDSVEAQKKFLERNNFEDPAEKDQKWWLPHVVKDGKIQYVPDYDYNIHLRHQENK